MQSKFKAGDRVLIIDSPYQGHATRMPGGKGTVKRVISTAVYIVDLDGDPYGDNGSEGNGWAFKDRELIATT